MAEISAGLLMFKKENGQYRVFLAHAGGPYWKNMELFGIPKGHVEPGEDLINTARREFEEETGIKCIASSFIDLGFSKTKANKSVYIWAFEGDGIFFGSNFCRIEYPRGSGIFIDVPENDRAEFFSLDEAVEKIFSYQKVFIDRFIELIASK